MQKADPLIRTKLRLPFIRLALVAQPRLQEQIVQGLRGPLTLVIAPAGFGKTTLLASCVTGCGMPVAWLSLDKNDNQAGRFLSYLIAALQEADTTIGSQAAQLLAASPPAPPETLLTSLINDLDIVHREMILVVDDYQFMSNQAVHEAMTFLLEHCPTTLHLVIASRSDPPLPVARLRAHSQTVELRAADLCFTEAEAAQFLNDVMGLHLDAGAVAALEERTEGWIAGLQMAALSMRDRKDVVGFIKGFSGTNRYILDYLLEEVLASQSLEIQRFLLCTSILERLTAPLCDAVLADDQGSKRECDDRLTDLESLFLGQSASVLEELERANLFLVPLDDERKWYRYHHLFADLLRARLDQLSPGLSTRLHARAATWYESNGFYEEAIHHALAASDYPGAARLVEAVAETAWLNGHYATILAWTKAIPTELVHSRPWLCIWNAWAFTQMGVSQALDQWITAAEQAPKQQHQDISSMVVLDASQGAQALMNEIAALRAFAVSFSHDYDRAIELAESVLKNPPLKNTKVAQLTRCNILHLLSSMYYAAGNLIKAEQTCQETIELAKEMGFTLRHLHSINKLILVNNVNGHLYRSYQLIEETLSFLQEQGCNTYFAASQLRFRQIELCYEWNQLEELQRLVEFVLKQEMLVDVPYLLVDSYNIQALALLNNKDYPGSQDALNKARALARQTYIWEGLTWRTESLQVRLWLKKGDLWLAVAWASQQAADRDDILRFSTESRAVARARILLAQGAWREAIALLDRLSASAEAEGRKGSLIEIRALKAIALLGLEELGQAVAEVEGALALAEPEGYVRTFLDEGDPMSTLLSHVANDASSPHANYALRLLTAFGEDKGSARSTIQPMVPHEDRASSLPSASSASLIEPLSRRELEVLHLMALGRTNQEIAQQLVVAPGTVKAHTASIYGKLDVANRTEAVARARQLGILP
jgi:LuxR family maltose regulon positive regulatory protein